MAVKQWQEIAAGKKAEQLSRIPKDWLIPSASLPPSGTVDLRPWAEKSGILTIKELEITGERYDATALAAAIAKGIYSAEEVTVAFCKRAAIAQQLTNCLTEICFLDAIKEAKGLDDVFKSTGKPVGPLHGIPMTFKECFHIKGYDASDGYIARCFQPSTYDSYLVQLVKSAGAVIIAKTNCPQTMLVVESENNVFGRTKNPVVSHLTCGGSSGGEGSAQGFRASALGIGTDAGSSVRVPAAANGGYGYKPSAGMLPLLGYANSNWPGLNTGLTAVCGPLGHSLRDLHLLTRAVRDQKPWLGDPSTLPHAFEVGTTTRKPVIGVIYENTLTLHPPVRRAITEAVSKLRAAGFSVKDFTLPSSFADVRRVSEQLLAIDGLSYAHEQLSKAGEPVVQSVKDIGFWDLPRKTPEEQWSWNAQKLGLQKQFLDTWTAAGIDVILCPVGPHTAVDPGMWKHDYYTGWVTVMDYPAVVIPYGVANPEMDSKYTTDKFEPLSEVPDFDREVQGWYDAEKMRGAPIGLQIVGPRLGDEQLLTDVQVIEDALKE